MKKPINQIAHGIGMQNQYLGNAVYDKKVIGALISGGNYHSDESWVDVDSVKEYVKWKFDNWVISKDHYEKAMEFLNNIIEQNK